VSSRPPPLCGWSGVYVFDVDFLMYSLYIYIFIYILKPTTTQQQNESNTTDQGEGRHPVDDTHTPAFVHYLGVRTTTYCDTLRRSICSSIAMMRSRVFGVLTYSSLKSPQQRHSAPIGLVAAGKHFSQTTRAQRTQPQ